MKRLSLGTACLTLLVFARAAAAEPSKEEIARADALFRAAQALMQAGSITEACAKFGESFAIDPAPGALLNQAACHEKDHKAASAAREYEQLVLLMSKGKTKDDRERLKFASDALARLEPSLTRAEYDVSAMPAGHSIKVDGAPLGPDDLGKPRPIEPGDHAIELSAPGKTTRTVVWKVLPQPGTQTFKAELVDPAAPAPGAAAPGAATPATAPAQATLPKLQPFTTNPPQWKRPVGFALAGVGVVGIGVGAYFGFDTFSKRSARDPHCLATFCDAEGISLNDKAHTSATISTIAFAAGFVAAGAGVYLLLTSAQAKKTAGWRAVPTASGLTVLGDF